jgi:hypothetical protein
MIAITATGMPTPMPIIAPVDRFVEELSVVEGVGVVFDEKLCDDIDEKLCVVIGEELCVMTDDDDWEKPTVHLDTIHCRGSLYGGGGYGPGLIDGCGKLDNFSWVEFRKAFAKGSEPVKANKSVTAIS